MPDDILKTLPKTNTFSQACDVQAWVERCLGYWRPQRNGYYYPDMLYKDDGTLSESRLRLAARYATEKNRLRRWWIGWWHGGKHYLRCAYQWQLIYGLRGETDAATTLSRKLSQAIEPCPETDKADAGTVPTPAQIFNWRQFAFFRSPMPLGVLSKNLSDGLAPFVRLSDLTQRRDRLRLPEGWQKRIDFEGDRIDGTPIQEVAERVRAYQRRGWLGRLWMRWWTDRGIQAQQRLYFYYQAQWTQTMVRHASSSDSHDRSVTLPQAYASVKACLEENYPKERRSIPRIAHQVASLPEMALDEEYPVLSPSQTRKAQKGVSQGLQRDWLAFQMHGLGLWQQAIRKPWQALLDFFSSEFDGSEWDAQREQAHETLHTVEARLSRAHSSFKSLTRATVLAYSHQLETLNTLLARGKALMMQSQHANQSWGRFKTASERLGHAQYYRKLMAECRAYPQTLQRPGHQLFQRAHKCLARRFASLVAEQEAVLVAQMPEIQKALMAEMSALSHDFRAEGEDWASWTVDVNSMVALDHRLETVEQGKLSQRYARVYWTLELLNERQGEVGGEKVVCSDDLTASRQHWLSQQVRAIAHEIDALDEQLKADAKASVEDQAISERGELQVPMARWRQWMRFYERYETLQRMLRKVEVNPSQEELKRLQQSLHDWLKAHCVAMDRDLLVLSARWYKQSRELERWKDHPYEQKELLDNEVWRDRRNGKYDTVFPEEVCQRYQWTYRLLERLDELSDIKLYEFLDAGVPDSFHTWFEFRYRMIEDELSKLEEQVKDRAEDCRLLEDRIASYEFPISLEGTRAEEEFLEGVRRDIEQKEGVHCLRLMDPGWEASAFIERCVGLRGSLQRMKIFVSREKAQGYLVQLNKLWEAALTQQLERMQTQLAKFGQSLNALAKQGRRDWFEGGASWSKWSKTQWLMRRAQMRQQYQRLSEWLARWDVGDGSYDKRTELTSLRNGLETVWHEGCKVSQYWEALWTQESAWRGFWQALKQQASLGSDGGGNESGYQTKREALRQSLMSVLSASTIVEAPVGEISVFIEGLLGDFEEGLGQTYSSVSERRERSGEIEMQSKTLLYRRKIFELVDRGEFLKYAIFCTLASLKLTMPKTVCLGTLIQQVQEDYGLACRELQKEVTELISKLRPDRDPDITSSRSLQGDVDPKTCTNIAALEGRYKDVISAYYDGATAGEIKKRLSSEKRALEWRLEYLYVARKNEVLPDYLELERLKSELTAFVGSSASESHEIQRLESAITDDESMLRLRLSNMRTEAMSLAEKVALLWVAPEQYETMWRKIGRACQSYRSTLLDWGQKAVSVISSDTMVVRARAQRRLEDLSDEQMTILIKRLDDKRRQFEREARQFEREARQFEREARQLEMEIPHLRKEFALPQAKNASSEERRQANASAKTISVSTAQAGLFKVHAQHVEDTEKQEGELVSKSTTLSN